MAVVVGVWCVFWVWMRMCVYVKLLKFVVYMLVKHVHGPGQALYIIVMIDLWSEGPWRVTTVTTEGRDDARVVGMHAHKGTYTHAHTQAALRWLGGYLFEGISGELGNTVEEVGTLAECVCVCLCVYVSMIRCALMHVYACQLIWLCNLRGTDCCGRKLCILKKGDKAWIQNESGRP